MTEEFTELRLLKRTRKKPQDGDIFVMEPKENLFYFGKVINDSVESKNLKDGILFIFTIPLLTLNRFRIISIPIIC